MTTKLTNIDAQQEAERAVIAVYEAFIAEHRNKIAELETQRPKELYVVLDKNGLVWGSGGKPLEQARKFADCANRNDTYTCAPYTLHKLTPCNDDGSVRS